MNKSFRLPLQIEVVDYVIDKIKSGEGHKCTSKTFNKYLEILNNNDRFDDIDFLLDVKDSIIATSSEIIKKTLDEYKLNNRSTES